MLHLERLLSWWARILQRYCLLLAAPIFALSVVSIFYVREHLGIDADTNEMFPADLPFRRAQRAFYEEFPRLKDILLVVVETGAPEIGRSIAGDLVRRLTAADERIADVYSYDTDLFLARHGLLFLEEDELETRANRLSEAQPFLAELMRDPSLRGLFSRLAEALEFREDLEIEMVDLFLLRVHEALEAAIADEPYLLSWQRLMEGGDDRETSRQLLFVNPRMDFRRLIPAEPAIEAVREIASEALADAPAVARVRLTGPVGLEYEEMQVARKGAIHAGILAFILVTLILIAGLRSLRLIVASVITLLCGLSLTAGIAALVVGTLNMVSIAFAVLYIGLGIDYAIHLCLHYRRSLAEGQNQPEAIALTLCRIGSALALCAASTAFGFYVFLLTDFQGVSELGLIAGTGVIVSLAVSLTVLPAVLKLVPFKRAPRDLRVASHGRWDRLLGLPERHPKFIRWMAGAIGILCLVTVPFTTFDYDPLNLRDQQSESVRTLRTLIAEGEASPWTIEHLAPTQARAAAMAERLREIEGADQVTSLLDFIPENQEAKLEIVATMDLLLGGLFLVPPEEIEPPDMDEQVTALENFKQALVDVAERNALYAQLHGSLDRFLARLGGVSENRLQAMLDRLEQSLLRAFDPAMEELRLSLTAEPVQMETLPAELRERWLSETGIHRLQVFPDPEIRDPNELRRFAYRVKEIFPEATGDLIVIISASEVVVSSFQEAFLYALIAISLLLLLYTRSWRDTGLILLPLLLAAFLTVAATVALKIPFNFANIIALPLLLGFGVDNGIHVVHRARQLGPGSRELLLRTSTARAIFYSSLTTIFSFGNLAFSPHPGSASMGLILTLGIVFILFATLVVLPAFLYRRQPDVERQNLENRSDNLMKRE